MRRAARTDNTAKELRAYAESLGFVVAHIGGVIDCLLIWGDRTIPCDWKSKNGELTKDQGKWIAKGIPIRFLSKPEQIDALRAELMHK
jgi:hypothetical protein